MLLVASYLLYQLESGVTFLLVARTWNISKNLILRNKNELKKSEKNK